MNVSSPAQILPWLLLVTRQIEYNKVYRVARMCIPCVRGGGGVFALLVEIYKCACTYTNKHTQCSPHKVFTLPTTTILEHNIIMVHDTYNSSNPSIIMVEYLNQCFYSAESY